MTRELLAVLGGDPVVTTPFKPYRSIGTEESAAVADVMASGRLSEFVGAASPNFMGGPRVQEFESACEKFFGVKHAISVNSWTSGLIAAVGAIGVSPGDEIIVPSWTMTATATAVLHWNAVPVFADIDPETFCISPESIEKNLSPRTKGVIAVDIFGQSSDIKAVKRIASSAGIKVISDSAQAPGARFGDTLAGTMGDIGGISLNYHKHINTGEGGVIFTNDDALARKMRLIRNHGEAVVDPKGEDIVNVIGHNFRFGEIEAAIGLEQLKKLPRIVSERQEIGRKIAEGLSGLEGLVLPFVSPENSHVYYIFGMKLEGYALRLGRERILDALRAEGVQGLQSGYQNIHLLPIYQQRIAYGAAGYPWTESGNDRGTNYQRGICPVSEELHSESFFGIQTCLFEFSDTEIDGLIRAFRKVWSGLNSLEPLAP